jgi:hypothetical protein
MRHLLTAVATLALIAGVANAQIQKDDIALGLDSAVEIVRNGALVPDTYSPEAVQSVEFDNSNGKLHAADGNLLGVAYSGGDIYTFGVDMSTGGTNIGSIGVNGGGLSVSPNNTKVALTAYDTGDLYVGDYVAGTSAGNWTTKAGVGNTFDTQGTTWLDDDNVLVAATSSGSYASVKKYEISTDTLSTVASNLGNNYTGFSDIEYNPEIAPYVYVMTSNYFSGTTTNILDVLDPTDWSTVASVDYSSSMSTSREIALDSEGNLVVSQFGSDVDNIVGADVPTSLSDNDSTDVYGSSTFSSFNGVDVASDVPEPASLSLLALGGIAALVRRRRK